MTDAAADLLNTPSNGGSPSPSGAVSSCCSDVFQMLIAMPNIAESTSGHIQSLLKVLESSGVCLGGDSAPLIENGRKAYLAKLVSRANAFRSKANSYDWTKPEQAGSDYELLRGFYHDVYYACFYLARYVGVSLGGYDCSRHAHCRKHLEALVKTRPPPAPAVDSKTRDNVGTLCTALSQFEEYRDTADYVINDAKVGAMSSSQILQSTKDTMEEVFALWGIHAQN